MTGPVAEIFLRAEREYDPIYLHYSQPSIQVDWLLESTVDGSTWHRRFSSFEAGHNRLVRVRNSWLKLFQDLGYSPRFISADELTQFGKTQPGNAVLVLPQSLALAEEEVAAVENFCRTGSGGVFCDGTPGAFNEHGRLRATNRLERLFPATKSTAASFVSWSPAGSTGATTRQTDSKPGDIAQCATDRLRGTPRTEWTDWARAHLRLPRAVTVPAEAQVRFTVTGLAPRGCWPSSAT